MRIRTKLALVLALAGIVLLMFVWLDGRRFNQRTDDFQKDQAAQKAKSFDTVFELIRAPHHNYVVDMTFWDELVDFIANPNDQWAATNIDSSAETFDVDFILALNLKRQIVYAYTNDEQALMKAGIKTVVNWDKVFQPGDRFCSYHIRLGDDIYEVDGATVHPTADPVRKTEPRGYLVIGKRYGEDFIDEIAKATGSELHVDVDNLSETHPRGVMLEDGKVHVVRELASAEGVPIALLHAVYRDASLSSFTRYLRKHFLFVVGFFTLFGLLLFILASYWVQRPLSQISSALEGEDLESLRSHGRTHRDFTKITGMLVDGIEQRKAVEREVEDRIRAESELLDARDEAQRANRAKSEFLANMSHEIRTPMNAVLGFTELALDKAQDEELRDHLGHIEYGGKMMLSLIDDILDMAKIEAGKMSVLPKPVDICDAMMEIMGIFSLDAERKGLELKRRCPDEFPPPVMVDPAKFRQVMVNLMGNAMKFTKQGSIEVGLDWRRLDDYHISMAFSVTDTGMGIAPEQKERIFQAFIQQEVQDKVEYGGTGLGLALSTKFCELMGARIEVESELGQGSRFVVTWPSVSIAESGVVGVTEGGDEQSKEPLGGMRILVADDDAATRLLLRACLERAGAQVDFAEDGEQAWSLIGEHDFDLVLSDLQMPTLDGMGLLKRLDEREEGRRPQFILMTATVTPEIQTQAQDLGAREILSKPLALQDLLRACLEATT